MARAESVTVFEVGPRDGLQNESRPVTLAQKIFLIEGLVAAGLRQIEVGAFVRPDRVPQMADSEAVFSAITQSKLIRKFTPWALVPNEKGLERAEAMGVQSVAVFTAASESFNRRNIGMSIEESLLGIKTICQRAKRSKIKVRGYVSTIFGCPFEGKVAPAAARRVMDRLFDLGIEQVSLGDTIGVATPKDVDAVLKPAIRSLGRTAKKRLAVHFHDTRGTALANTLRSLDLGIRTIDSSAGGLGGCPFAPGATGNLATEDLVYLLSGMGFDTGVDLKKLSTVSFQFCRAIGRPISSNYLRAFAAQQE